MSVGPLTGTQLPQAAFGMPPQQARELAALITKAADAAELFASMPKGSRMRVTVDATGEVVLDIVDGRKPGPPT